MPSDYSHVTDKPAHDFVDSVSSMLDDKWSMSHSALTEDFLAHHGIQGMHWGVRRFQNHDGSWTTAGLARRRSIASNIKNTAKKANEAIATAARKTFNPTVADMDEKIAKAKEKQLIRQKKNQLREIQGKDKKIRDMSNQEIQNEIESRKQRRYLKQMREQESTTKKGVDFAAKVAKAASTPAKVAIDIAGDTAAYGLRKAGEALVDHAIDSAKWKADKEYKRKYNDEHKSELDKVKEQRELAEAKAGLKNQKLSDEVNVSRLKNEKSRLEREATENYFQRSVLDADDIGSKKAASRLKDLKNVRSNDNNGKKDKRNKNNNRNNNQYNNRNDRNDHNNNRDDNRNNNRNNNRHDQNGGNRDRNKNEKYNRNKNKNYKKGGNESTAIVKRDNRY